MLGSVKLSCCAERYSSGHHTVGHSPQLERIYWYCIQDNQWKIIGTNSRQKVPFEFKDNSSMSLANPNSEESPS